MTKKPTFDTLIDSHADEIFAYLWRLFQGRDTAEDCFQETFLRAFKAYPRLQSDAHLRAWLYKIASNTAFTMIKKERRLGSGQVELKDIHASNERSVAGQVADQLLLEEVRAAIETLPDRQRAALLMKKYQGLNYAEVGRALSCSPAAARASAYQALRKIRSRFADTEEQEALAHAAPKGN